MSSVMRSSCVAAADARAAFSRRHSCQGPSKKNGFVPPSSSTAVVTASRNQRSWATRITAASSEVSSRSSHSRLSTSRWFVGSSSSSRSGSDGEGARERGAGQLAARERVERPVEVGVDESEAADDRRRAVAPGPAAGVLEPRLRLAVASQRRVGVVAAGHGLLQSPQLVLDRDEVCRAGERVLPQREPLAARRALVVQRDACVLRKRELTALERGLADRAPAGASSCPPRSGLRARARSPRRSRNETPSKSGSPENSLRSPDAISTAMD